MKSRISAAALASAIAAATISCSDMSGPSGRGSIEILAGGQIADSVGSPPDSLIVQVKDESGAPARGVEVRFTPSTDSVTSAASVRLLGGTTAEGPISVRTDATGRVILLVQLVYRAGESTIEVEVPELDLSHVIHVTTLPGQPGLAVAGGPFYVRVGGERAVNPLLKDQHNNVVAGPISCTVAGGLAAIENGCVIRGLGFGVDTLTVKGAGWTRTAVIDVEPPGLLAADGLYSTTTIWTLDGVKQGELSSSLTPEWVPGSDSLLVTRSGVAGIWVVPRTGSGSGRLLVIQGAQARIDALGEWVYYVVPGAAGGSDIWRVRRNGTGAVPVVRSSDSGAMSSSPSPSPDGTSVAFVHRPAGARFAELRVVELASGQTRTIATSSIAGSGSLGSPAWSPTGEWIAWVDFDVPSSSAGGAVRMSHPDGSGVRTLIAAGEQSVSWSRDGRYLAVVSKGDFGVGGIVIVDVVTGVVVGTPLSGSNISWN